MSSDYSESPQENNGVSGSTECSPPGPAALDSPWLRAVSNNGSETVGPDAATGFPASQASQTFGVSVEQVEVATACTLRHESLAPLFLVGDADGGTHETQPTMPQALRLGFLFSHGIIWEAAAAHYREHGQVPDRATLLVRALPLRDRLREQMPGMPIAEDLPAVIERLYGPEHEHIEQESARQLAIEVIEELLVHRPKMHTYSQWGTFGGELQRQFLDRADRIHDELTLLQNGGRQRLRGYSVAELREVARPPQWHARGLLVRDETCFIAGPMKALKSGLGVDLAVSLAMPIDGDHRVAFLNRFVCEPARHVLLFSAESGMWITRGRIDHVFANKPLPLGAGNRRRTGQCFSPDMLNLTTYFDAPRLSTKQDQLIVRREIREHNADIAIFDPFYLMALAGTETDASNVFQMGDTIRRIEDVCKQEHCTPVFVHHFTKAVKIGTVPTLASMSYAGSAEMAAQWILLNHRRPYDTEIGLCRLMMYAGGRAGQAGCWGVDILEGRLTEDFGGRTWHAEVMSLEEAKERDQDSDDRQDERQASRPRAGRVESPAEQVCRVLARLPQGRAICVSPLATQAHMHPRTCQQVVDQLIAAGQVERAPVPVNNREHDGVRLTEEAWLAAHDQEPEGASDEEEDSAA